MGGIATLCTRVHSSAVIILATIGTVSCFVALLISYTFTKELFPTLLRTTALSTTSAIARIGSMAAPAIGELESIGGPVAPLMVYGGFILSAAVCSFWVWPEMNRNNLPSTLEECEELAKINNKWLNGSCCKSNIRE